METLRDLDLVRVASASVTVRAAAKKPKTQDMPDMPMPAATLGRLAVRFSPFDTWYEVNSNLEGNFLERTVKGAFAKTMQESKANIRALYDHGNDPQIGNKVLAATDVLTEEDDSAVLEGDLFDTSYNRDLLPGLQAGVYGSSFRFRVIQDAWNDVPARSAYNPQGIPERTITEVRLFEAGPVTFPANPTATSAVRSMTDTYYERLRARDPQTYDDVVARARSIRTPQRSAAATSTATDDGAAQNHPDEPVTDHSTGRDQRRRREVLFPYLEGALQ